MNIKDAVFRKHMSLLAAGVRSDYFDEKPLYSEFRKTIVARTIENWGK